MVKSSTTFSHPIGSSKVPVEDPASTPSWPGSPAEQWRVGPLVMIYKHPMNNEKNPGCLGQKRWWKTTQVYIGSIIYHYKDPYETIIRMACREGFERCSDGCWVFSINFLEITYIFSRKDVKSLNAWNCIGPQNTLDHDLFCGGLIEYMTPVVTWPERW